MVKAFLGIGSNVGDREGNLEDALSRLQNDGDIKITKRSAFYRTPPVGGPPQKDYLNGVLEIETAVPPKRLLGLLKDVEREMGRKPAGRDHSRVIDIDILLYGDLRMNTEDLTIPHPRMHERSFVLHGLDEIAPEATHPVMKATMGELYRDLNKRQC